MPFEGAIGQPLHEVERLVGVHGRRLIAGLAEPADFFVQVVRSSAGKA
jgi:hypothetical protein